LPVDDKKHPHGIQTKLGDLMSFPTNARRVAVFTIFLFASWTAVTAAASAMIPDPQDTSSYNSPAPDGGGMDVTTWLLAAVAVAVVVAVAAGVAATLHHRHIHTPTARPAVH
jgi:hypothetical protein